MPRFLSGIKPTGSIHIGNYFGAMRQFIELQNSGEFESFVMVADLHALNQIQDAEELRRITQEIILAYLAVGLDPEKTTIFKQSDVPEHAELSTVFGAITSMGLLERAHAYKDAQAKGKSVNAGLFTYPVLMSADILLYKPDVVPVGKDQQQHVEIAVDIANRFNHLFGQTFSEPKPVILGEAGVVPGVDGRKMSKSYGNVIGLFDAPEVVTKKVAGITTDSRRPEEPKDPDADTLFKLHQLVATAEELNELRQRYEQGGISYKESKDLLAERLNRFLDPFRTRREELLQRPEYIREVIEQGRERASRVAQETMNEVKEKVGLR